MRDKLLAVQKSVALRYKLLMFYKNPFKVLGVAGLKFVMKGKTFLDLFVLFWSLVRIYVVRHLYALTYFLTFSTSVSSLL